MAASNALANARNTSGRMIMYGVAVLSTTPPRPVAASRSSAPRIRAAGASASCHDTEMPLTGM